MKRRQSTYNLDDEHLDNDSSYYDCNEVDPCHVE